MWPYARYRCGVEELKSSTETPISQTLSAPHPYASDASINTKLLHKKVGYEGIK